jgi:RNA polymerase sigma-70 factor (ECF subfamily)
MHRRVVPPSIAVKVEPIQAADPDFISQMINDCDRRVYRLALRITRNDQDAEDARQETMLKAYRHIDKFEGRSRFTTWISRIAINEALMNLRKRNDARHLPLEDVVEKSEDIFALRQFRPPAENPESNFRRRELRASIDEAIHSLGPLYRDVFILRAAEERSTSETARVLRLTTSTVKTRLRRACAKLREELAKPCPKREDLAAD